ncbi:putative ABC transporter permease [Rhodococcus pyridinivorans AK37]|nr:putative ABC transporter permease [Rhodococcus pyridinivorans AK37]
MFGILRFVTDSSVVQFLGFFATMLLIVALSMLVGAIQHRWRATGLLTAAASVVVIGGLAATLVTWTRSWSSLWSWIVDASPTTTLVVLPLLVAAVCVGATWQPATRHPRPAAFRNRFGPDPFRVGAELRARSASGGHGRVRISAPVSVTTMVCSNCAVHLRSLVTTVQPSSQIS